MKAPARWLPMMVLILAATGAWASPSVKLVASPYQSPGAGDDVVIAVSASQADDVTSMDLRYAYDPTVLTPTGAFLTGYTSSYSLQSNLTTPGVVEIHVTGATALSGSGEIAWVTFHIAAGAVKGSTTPLSWIFASLNGGAIPCGQQGLDLAIGSAPTTISAPKSSFGASGTQVAVPISASSLPGGSSLDLVVVFDPTVLSAVSVQKASLTSCMTLVSNVAVPGTVRVSLYGLCSISGSGPLVTIVFNAVGASGRRTPLNVTRASVDEDHYPIVLQDGLFNVCGTPDGDGDGYSVCAGDCNDASASVHPGALEVCNGVDDDCDGAVDDAAPPVGVPSIGFAADYGDTRISWASTPAATGYDVVRGGLAALRVSGGDFSIATGACLADHAPGSDLIEVSIPAEGDGFWYLVRPTNCGGAGSFDGARDGQPRPRDPGINAAPSSCR